MKNLKHSKMVWPVKAPFMIAYREKVTGRLDLQPYVDLHWKMKIWGIAFNNMVFKLTHEPGADWWRASGYKDASDGVMPTTAELDEAYLHKDGFNEIVDFLNSQGVKAEYWQPGWYWSTEDDGDNATVLDMENGNAELVQKNIKNGYTRLVSHKIGSNKHITVCFPLAYLRQGRFETSLTLYLSRLDELWGIKLGKGYISLTEEPKKMTWSEGKELAARLSNDQIKYSLPKKEVFSDASQYRDSFNDALIKLEAYGVHTDLWNDSEFMYLTSSEYEGDYFMTYRHVLVPKSIPCACRLYARERGDIIVI